MKKSAYFILVIGLIFAAQWAAAQGQQQGMRPEQMQRPGMGMMENRGMAQGQGMMPGQGMGMMQGEGMGMMHGMMGGKSIVSSNDGGVIVLSGNTLYKYDKNLTLVKSVELPTPQMGMMENKGAMMEKKSGCGCGGGMCGEHQSAQESKEGQASTEHQAHH